MLRITKVTKLQKYEWLRIRKFRFLLTLLFALGLFLPGVVLAEDPAPVSTESICECFCGKKGVGTIGPVNTKFGECRTLCKEQGAKFVACTTSFEQYPTNNLRCFTKPQCEKETKTCVSDGSGGEKCTTTTGIYELVQPFNCPSGKSYCYNPPVPYELAVAIGGQTTVLHVGQYIDLVYRWLLTAGLTIAIVMMMIGGLQYAVGSATGSKEVAKKRILNAAVGVVLLLMTWMILYTVNPNLTKLSLPTLPKIRKIVLISGEPSCEKLLDKEEEGGVWKLDVPAGTVEACGGQAKVLEDAQGNSVAGGTLCNFTKCKEAEAKCYGRGNTAKCVSCKEVTNEQDDPKLPKPSAEVCAQLSLGNETDQSGNTTNVNQCFWTTDFDLALDMSDTQNLLYLIPSPPLWAGLIAFSSADAVTTGTCAQVDFDCNEITDCFDYNFVIAESDEEEACMVGIDPWPSINIGGKNIALGGSLDLKKFCIADPCGMSKKGLTCIVKESTVPLPVGSLTVDLCMSKNKNNEIVNKGFSVAAVAAGFKAIGCAAR